MARAGWFWWCIMVIALGIMWLWEQIPVLVRRGEYRRLRDNDCLIKDAVRAISENARLREKYEPVTIMSRKVTPDDR